MEEAMEEIEFKQKLKEKAKKFEIDLSTEQQDKFYNYMQLLLEWNEKMNLTAITEPEEVLDKHFIDSISIVPYIKENESILDIGTGAGFPGIPIKIAFPDSYITLLDSLNKRVNFLNEVIKELQLTDTLAIHSRAEEFAKVSGKRESYDVVVSRAVAKLNVLLEYMLPFVKIGGKCICMKSLDIDDELKEAKKAIEILGGKIQKIDEITLPDTNISRKFVIIEKVKRTPEKYPRKAGTPVKEPIC